MDTFRNREAQRLATRFPALKNAAGVWPFSPNQLDIWAAEHEREPKALQAARFVLHLWNRQAMWECGKFDFLEALDIWDDSHVRPFLEWLGQKRSRL